MAVERIEQPPAIEAGAATEGVVPVMLGTGHAVAAFIGRTERGPTNRAVPIRHYNHYRQVFGGHSTFTFVSYAVQHYFLHGGKSAVVVRVVNRANRALIRLRAADQFLELEARYPGSREFIRVSVDYDGVEKRADRFNLVVQRLGRPNSPLVEDQEIFALASINPADPRFIGELLRDSRLIALRSSAPAQRPDATRPRFPGEPIPYVEAAVNGSDGAEITAYDIIGSDRDRSGLFALDAVDRIDLLCIPPPPGRDHDITTFLGAERYCERRHAMLVWDPPLTWQGADSAVLGARETALRSHNALTYFPRVRPRLERTGLPLVLPACGAIAGVLASRTEFGDWSAGSADDPLLKISLAPEQPIGEATRLSLNRAGVNALRLTEVGGASLVGNVTLASPSGVTTLAQRLDRRRLLLFVLTSIERAGAHVGDNDPERAFERFALDVQRFLSDLRGRGALAGAYDDQAFAVRRMSSEAPGIGRLRVGLALDVPGEFLHYDFELGRGIRTARHVPALEAEQLAG
jgi:Bacteriophage tail sheath protein